MADDKVVYESAKIEMQTILEDLKSRYGNHPVLIETEADFSDDAIQQINLYEQAKALVCWRMACRF